MPAAPAARILKHPHPYRASLAVSNDADLLDWESFLEVYRFLNTEGPTRFGRGVGLPVSTSLFMYSVDPRPFAYFEGLEARPSARAGAIRELMRSGLIDTLHGYGDWGTYEGIPARTDFTRAHAERALEELERHGLRVSVWTNHGHENSLQNVSSALFPRSYEQGDRPESPAYHADLLDAHGVRFFWAENTSAVGQDVGVKDLLRRWRGFPRWHRVISREYLSRLRRGRNRLLAEGACGDGRLRTFFLRYRGPRRAVVNNLGHQLSPATVETLVSLGGTFVLYTHFGARDVDGVPRPNVPPWLPERFVEGLRRLRQRRDEGRVWVAPLAHLLAMARLRDAARVTAADGPEGLAVRIVPKAGDEGLRPWTGGLSVEVRGEGHERMARLLFGEAALPFRAAAASRDATVYQVPGALVPGFAVG